MTMAGLSPVTCTTLDALWKGGYRPLAVVSSLPDSWTLSVLVDVDAASDEADPGRPDNDADPTGTTVASSATQEHGQEYDGVQDEQPGNQAEEEESDDSARGKHVSGRGCKQHAQTQKRRRLCDSELSRHAAQRNGLHLVYEGDLVPLGRSKKPVSSRP
jgi:hypothetical protein